MKADKDRRRTAVAEFDLDAYEAELDEAAIAAWGDDGAPHHAIIPASEQQTVPQNVRDEWAATLDRYIKDWSDALIERLSDRQSQINTK